MAAQDLHQIEQALSAGHGLLSLQQLLNKVGKGTGLGRDEVPTGKHRPHRQRR
ncbi:hypothetical protein D3C72_2596260 [compost metagenome]